MDYELKDFTFLMPDTTDGILTVTSYEESGGEVVINYYTTDYTGRVYVLPEDSFNDVCFRMCRASRKSIKVGLVDFANLYAHAMYQGFQPTLMKWARENGTQDSQYLKAMASLSLYSLRAKAFSSAYELSSLLSFDELTLFFDGLRQNYISERGLLESFLYRE